MIISVRSKIWYEMVRNANHSLNARLLYTSENQSDQENVICFFYFLLDTTAPVINCTQDMVVSTDPGLYYATLNLTMPLGHGKRADQPRYYGFQFSAPHYQVFT